MRSTANCHAYDDPLSPEVITLWSIVDVFLVVRPQLALQMRLGA